MEKRKKLEEIQQRLSTFFTSAADRVKSTISKLDLPPTLDILESIITLDSPRKKNNPNCRKDRWYHPRDCPCFHCKNHHDHKYEKEQEKIYKEEFEHFKNIQHKKYLNHREKRNHACIDRRNVTCCFDGRESFQKRECHTFQDFPRCSCERRPKKTANRQRSSLCNKRCDDNWICQSESKILPDKLSRVYHTRLPINSKRSAYSPQLKPCH